jgi:uncharacterized membrane protein
MTPRAWSWLARVALVALIVLCVLWEGWLAPIRPGGSWLTLKALPLMFAVRGVLHGRRYTSQWLSMVVLLYFIEGVLRAFDPGLIGPLAWVEIVLSVLLFVAAVGHAHMSAPSRDKAAS